MPTMMPLNFAWRSNSGEAPSAVNPMPQASGAVPVRGEFLESVVYELDALIESAGADSPDALRRKVLAFASKWTPMMKQADRESVVSIYRNRDAELQEIIESAFLGRTRMTQMNG